MTTNMGTDAGCDAGEGVGEHAGDGDGGVGEAVERGEPVGRGDVAADGEGDGVGAAGADRAEDDQEQSEGGDDLAEPEPGCRSVVSGDGDGSQAEHQVGDDSADDAARRPGRRSAATALGVDTAPRARSAGDDGVERSRDRLQREDQRDERGAGDRAVLQQLEPDVVRRQPRRGDPRADHGGDEERRAENSATPAGPGPSSCRLPHRSARPGRQRARCDAVVDPRRRASRDRADRLRGAP